MTSAKTAEANAARDVAALKSKLAAVLCSFCLESFHGSLEFNIFDGNTRLDAKAQIQLGR
jgi:hypothetical protein